ncbi:acetyl/propionyl/methylcrotonyl-CoA carboxylase subunit alpha [Tahibacter amnicola]|uniref:ATP-grasp domain-containing protein n=1 Tax=Tahibacter amnicola TaxID=2976241 RepID=A0ABY6B8N5_9GAMM|nr:biotin carboxylase N-terminal domain-containing protein [Tahibacter amnicola]UXI66441.1 ATP-grasp domain-containing protein [Tahibacter amnicola]
MQTLLIANRGEIACRIARTARAMGIRTVAVYSDADADALHVHGADSAIHIGGSMPAESYLNIDALIVAARRCGADAIHPGYGFLSENAAFAAACRNAGITFVGPSPEAIAAMGSKAAAKQRAATAGVPTAPASYGPMRDDAQWQASAETLGYPLLVKAVAGGGGRGMRRVDQPEALAAALASARREAQIAFGDDALLLEKLIEDGRHIEIQIVADAHGHLVHLGERDCSTQRRRQKIIEEAPSPVLSAALRERMGQDAIAVARAVGYCGAGTVEFIVDPQMRHYFLEMNTRIQVEHPVTELITGIDLVEWQLRIADGEPLPLAQDAIRFRGHAIEARLYAEDPYAGFAPQTGRIARLRPDAAACGTTIRIDAGVREGDLVTSHYDPLLAKVIAHGATREEAIRKLACALEDVAPLGMSHNGAFLRALVADDLFRKAAITTATLDSWSPESHPLLQPPAVPSELWALAATCFALGQGNGHRPPSVSAFEWRVATERDVRRLGLRQVDADTVAVTDGGVTTTVHRVAQTADTVIYRIDGLQRRCAIAIDGNVVHLSHHGGSLRFERQLPPYVDRTSAKQRGLQAPLSGTVAQVLVQPGDRVTAGQPLVCVEAMKMEVWLSAQADATVRAIHTAQGQNVDRHALLVELEFDTTEA